MIDFIDVMKNIILIGTKNEFILMSFD